MNCRIVHILRVENSGWEIVLLVTLLNLYNEEYSLYKVLLLLENIMSSV